MVIVTLLPAAGLHFSQALREHRQAEKQLVHTILVVDDTANTTTLTTMHED